jgi:hypothetical protein
MFHSAAAVRATELRRGDNGRTWVLRLAAFAVAIMTAMVLASSASAATGQLSYNGGPVLHSSAPYLVFWAPGGESIPASSQGLMERYFADVAADSGKSSNVFGVLRQYYDRTGFADYRQTFNPARQVIVDPQPYPAREAGNCPEVSSLYPTCISDGQIESELQRLITADHLPSAGSANAAFPAGSAPARLSANAPIYFVILPTDVEVCNPLGSLCTGDQNCGYHWDFVDAGGDVVLYAALPLKPLRAGSILVPDPKGVCQLDGTSVVQAPDGDVNADLVIGGLSHEDSEAINDPTGNSGWFNSHGMGIDKGGQEGGDECEMYGPFNPLKGSNPNSALPTLGGSEAAGTLYTQLINGHPYYLQSEWSNGDNNCEMRPSPGRIVPRFTVPRGANKAGASLSFDPAKSTSTNALSSATWNFGDGSQTSFFYGRGTLSPAKHRYRKAGRYTVTLTLVDNRGNLQTTTRGVTVHAH